MTGGPAPSLATNLCGITLRNPVLAASGTFGYGVEFQKLVDLNALGGLVVKGLSREPIEGNPAPRVYETEAGMINSIGLQNIGVRAFAEEKLPALARFSTPVFANVFGYQVDDYVEVARVLEDHAGLAGYELNVSCPNTRDGGIFFSSDPSLLGEVVAAVNNRVPVFVDGGFRRGTDIFKALALGAKAVGIGRPMLWGLGAFGQPGVERVVEILQGELRMCMGNCGTRTVADITSAYVEIPNWKS